MTAERLQDILELYRFKEGGGTYTSTCILKYQGNTVEIKGLSGSMSREYYRELREHLVSHGVTEVTYEIKGREITRKLIKRKAHD